MDVGSVYGSYYETAKSYMGLRKEEKQAGFAEKVTHKSQVSSEDMTLEEYKEYFNEKMNSLYTHPSQRNRNDIMILRMPLIKECRLIRNMRRKY